MSETVTTIFKLPEDVWPAIFNGLSYPDIVAFSKTNKNARYLVTEYVRYIEPKRDSDKVYFRTERDFEECIKRSMITEQLLFYKVCVAIINSSDVSALGGVHTLRLSCTDIRDVSALGKVYSLNLSDCNSITDVSALGGVHT